ncbi:DNA damage-binding protein 2 [Clupea harengus]|uniref:DNA damage-binding protein 2 n=1 Tax=Clupea harengus TaxID=7950 RepID=A0A8M1KE86_CLUHA|nr:DNA damage-binding protein 2 [Clupea harengus]
MVFGDKPIVIFRIMARKKTTENIQAKNNNNNASSSGVKKKRKSDTTSETLTKKLKAKKDEKASGTGNKPPCLKCSGDQKKGNHGSILHYFYKNSLGQSIHSHLRQCLQEPFVRSLASYRVHSTASPFDRRVTCLEWHPTLPTTLAVGSKGGDIVLWDYNGPNKMSFVQGKGAGDFIGGMKFCPSDSSRVYAASGDGSLTLQSFQGLPSQTLSRAQDCGHTHHNVCYWYCCVDVSASRQMLATGDNTGRLVLLGLDGHKIFEDKLHKAKLTHAEFNPRCDWLLATASVDSTVKLWDLRNLKDKKSFLHEMQHNKPVNSAYFNPTDSSKLLTTDQGDEIRVYASSDWSKPEHIIQHPHRHFQHITSIKATWHPIYDLIVAGRYPDDRICVGDVRSVDIFDANTGALECQMLDPNTKGIISLNKFNPLGDVLASGMGFNVLVWNREDVVNGMQESLLKKRMEENRGQAGTSRTRSRQQRPPRDKKGTAEDLKLKKKLASLESTETKSKTQRNRKKLD